MDEATRQAAERLEQLTSRPGRPAPEDLAPDEREMRAAWQALGLALEAEATTTRRPTPIVPAQQSRRWGELAATLAIVAVLVAIAPSLLGLLANPSADPRPSASSVATAPSAPAEAKSSAAVTLSESAGWPDEAAGALATLTQQTRQANQPLPAVVDHRLERLGSDIAAAFARLESSSL